MWILILIGGRRLFSGCIGSMVGSGWFRLLMLFSIV